MENRNETIESKYWKQYIHKGVLTKSIKYPQMFQHGNGMVTTHLIPNKTAFIACPVELAISQQKGSENDKEQVLNILKDLVTEIDESYVYLINWVLRQKLSEDNPWMKLEGKGMVNFNFDVILNIQDKLVIKRYEQQKKIIQKYFRIFYNSLKSSNKLDNKLNENQYQIVFKEAYAFVSNRSFDILQEVSLLPIIDCVNHSKIKQNMSISVINIYFQKEPFKYIQWHEQMIDKYPNSTIQKYSISRTKIDLSMIQIDDLSSIKQLLSNCHPDSLNVIRIPMTHVIAYSIQQISAGQEIFINYGNKSNIQLLVNYGFSEQLNKNQYLSIFINQQGLFYNQIDDRCQIHKLVPTYQSILHLAIKLSKYKYFPCDNDQQIIKTLYNELTQNPYSSSFLNPSQYQKQSDKEEVKYFNIYLQNKQRIFYQVIRILEISIELFQITTQKANFSQNQYK